MIRLNKLGILSRLRQFLSLFCKKLLNFVTMRRLLTRVMNRVLLSEAFTPVMGSEAQIHAQGPRKLVSLHITKVFT